ncbi:MAG: ribonuclease P protein component [Candidatus Kapabacteria bacterium]|nr:ribonuclease P protein component [Candidatus Kapabacteria bacterium]
MIKIKPIKGFNSFTMVFKSGKKFYDSEIVGIFIYPDTDDEGMTLYKCNDKFTFYYGVTAGKKFIKKAVVRNRVKRLLRESIRQIFKERYAGLDSPPFRYAVFSVRNAPRMQSLISLADIYPSVERIFNSAENYKSARGSVKK